MAIPPTSTLPKSSNPFDKLRGNPFAPRKYGELQQVTERVYIFRNITNSSFVIGDRSVAVIDTQVNLSSAAELLRLLRTVTDKPISHVINTHYHWDHTNGNALFKKEGATVVSSKRTKDFMVSRAERQKEFLSGRGFELGEDPFLPEKTFEGEWEMDLGNMPLRLFFAGRAETDDATAIHVVKEKVVMSGDTVMTGSFPIFGQPVWDEGLQDGEWIQTIGKIMELGPSPVVPGHGPLAYQKEIDLLIRIEKYFLEEVGARIRKGMDLGSVLSEMEPRLPSWITTIPVVWGTPRYAILRVFRGLTKKSGDEELGWQQFKPSAMAGMAHEAKEGGDIALQLSILKKDVQTHPNSADALAAYADALVDASKKEASVLEKGDFFQAARAAWNRAIEIDSSHVPTLLGKGRYLTMMAYRGGDDPSAGMKILRKVVETQDFASLPAKVRAEAQFYLGMGHRRLGDEEKAKAQFQKALQEDPSFFPAVMASRD